MRLFGFDITRERKDRDLDAILRNLAELARSESGEVITPDTAMRCTTVRGIVRVISDALVTLPVEVLRKSTDSRGRQYKEKTDHELNRLLKQMPEPFVCAADYWRDAADWLLRYGNFYALKVRNSGGRIMELVKLAPWAVTAEENSDRSITYRVTMADGGQKTYGQRDIHHVRMLTRDGVTGVSPIEDCREAIALAIAAERFGAQLFGNGAVPYLVVKGPGHFKTDEARERFKAGWQEAFSGKGRRKTAILESGWDLQQVNVNAEEGQFIELRKFQRVEICGAFGVPPHRVADLERATFSNIEHQSLEFVRDVVLPYVRTFENAMERDLLTPQERNAGLVIRFNIDGALRGDFKSRQEGLRILRQEGIINANEWREHEGLNPIAEDDGGEEYRVPVNTMPAGEEPEPEPDPQPPEDGDDV